MKESPEYLKMKAEFEAQEKRKPKSAPVHLTANPDATVAQAIEDAYKGKKVRHVFIEATFPELKGGQMYQHAHGEASGTKPAIARAFKNLLKTIPKKRISVISAKISITTKIVEG
jgi:hypothetical protein